MIGSKTMTLISQRKRAEPLFGSAQVYVQNGSKVVTETARSANRECTKKSIGARTGKERPQNTWKTRALSADILETLNRFYRYDSSLGRLVHIRGFATKGRVASYGKPHKYRYICFGGKEMREHRAIWMMVNDALIPEGHEIDHINRDVSDNRSDNLRLVTRGQNQWNAGMRKDNTSGFKGVSETRTGAFSANISINGKVKYLGAFPTALEAYEAYQRKALELRGEYVPTPGLEGEVS